MDDAGEHDAGEAEVVESFEGGVESFVVSCETAEAGSACVAAFDDSSARQEDNAPFRHRVLDDLEADAVLLGSLCRCLAGVALIDTGHNDGVAGHLLHLLGQRRDLRPVAFVGRGDGERHEVSFGVDRDMSLQVFSPLGSIVACLKPVLPPLVHNPTQRQVAR